MKPHVIAHLSSRRSLRNVLENPHLLDQTMKTTTTIWMTDMIVQSGKHLVTFLQNGSSLVISKTGDILGIFPQNEKILVIFMQNGNSLVIFKQKGNNLVIFIQ